MASEKQISANRRNATKSTGPKTNNGKLQSRRNAMRHGLTATTVVTAIEDVDEFERFGRSTGHDDQRHRFTAGDAGWRLEIDEYRWPICPG
jgi:hypothetical protein